MSTSSEIHLSETLNHVSIQFNRYFSIFIFLFGIIGNILNCIVLSQPPLRVNPCAFLFLISSAANIISIASGLTTRMLSGWDLDFTTTHSVLCKIRAFIMLTSRTVAFWLIAFATIDRWFVSSSHHQRRQMSTLKNSQRGTIFIIIISIVCYGQVINCYDARLTSTPLQCYAKTVSCRLITDIIYGLITVLLPLCIMCIFGIMTISNVRQTYNAVLFRRKIKHEDSDRSHVITRINGPPQQRKKRIDRYLRHVLFIQIILLTIFTLPLVLEKMYTTLTLNAKKSSLHSAIEKFIYNIALLLGYLASGMPFYVYTLAGGSLFRATLRNSFSSIFKSRASIQTRSAV